MWNRFMKNVFFLFSFLIVLVLVGLFIFFNLSARDKHSLPVSESIFEIATNKMETNVNAEKKAVVLPRKKLPAAAKKMLLPRKKEVIETKKEILQNSNVNTNEKIQTFIEFYDKKKNKKSVWIKEIITNENANLSNDSQGFVGDEGDVVYKKK